MLLSVYDTISPKKNNVPSEFLYSLSPMLIEFLSMLFGKVIIPVVGEGLVAVSTSPIPCVESDFIDIVLS